MRPSANSLPRPWVGFVLALLFLAGQLSSFAHLVLVNHVTCPEHGELVHASAIASSSSARAEPSERASWVDSIAGQADHHHEHCLLAASRREKGLVSSSVRALLPATTLVPSQPSSSGAIGCSTVPLLRLAPKSSPPV